MFVNREQPRVNRAPFIEHRTLECAFFVSHVPYEEFDVVAPTLEHEILEVGPMKYGVVYQATGKHDVKLKIGGKEISHFTVTKVPGTDIALVEDCCYSSCAATDAEKQKLATTQKALVCTQQKLESALTASNNVAFALTKAEAEIEMLKSEKGVQSDALAKAMQKVGIAEKAQADAEQKVRVAVSERDKALEDADRARKTLTADAATRVTTKKELATAVKARKNAGEEIAKLQAQVKTLPPDSQKLIAAENELATAKTDLEGAEAKIRALEDQVRTLNDDAATLATTKEELAIAMKYRETAGEEIVKIQAQVDALNTEVATQKGLVITAAQQASKAAQGEITTLETKVAALTVAAGDPEAAQKALIAAANSERD
eukprot:1117044_1